jgi:hypothetical protein
MFYEYTIQLCKRLSKILGVIAIILFIFLAFFMYETLQSYRIDTSNESIALEQDIIPPAKAPAFDSYKSVLEGSHIFRPPLYVETIAAQKEGKKQLQLQGITGREGHRGALIYDPDTDSVSLYAEGQYIRDLKVERITTDSVILGHGEDRVELKR